MTVKILGTDYEIVQNASDEVYPYLKDNDAYIDYSNKTIYIQPITKENGYNWANLKAHEKRTMRHEIVHGFMHESGLDINSDWGRDESLIDWIALQFPKMLQAFIEIEAL